MCGIAGIYYPERKDTDELSASIKRMTSCLSRRGPDDDGYYIGGKAALGHRRLSIIDLKTGRQPIFNEDKSKCIVYNGEVFNYQELRDELIKDGHRFSTKTDTETILHGYEQWGEECVNRLRGMFAFCILDCKDESMFIARDRLGIKPLFYSSYNGKFAFASEMKSILSDTNFNRIIEDESLASYFIFSYIPAPLSIFKNIQKLLPGHTLTFKDGKINIKKYWDIVYKPDRQKKEKDFINESMGLLRESVRLRLISDVPLGAFLSGGIDSSTVVALMSAENNTKVNSFTIGFGKNIGGFDDERKYARLVAERYNTNHREYEVSPVMDGLIDRIVESFDEPFADDATIPTYFISKMARENVKVILSGLGGDEDFCGYERYLGFHISHIYNKAPQILREGFIKKMIEKIPEFSSMGNRVNHLKRFVRSSSSDIGHRYLGYVTKLNERYRGSFFSSGHGDLTEAFDSSRKRFLKNFDSPNADEPLNKIFYCDVKTYLPDDILACTDRLSMYHSLEVRVPFLDHKLMEYCATIPPELKIKGFHKKYLLKKAVAPLLPSQVISHKKQGFVGPMSWWLKRDLKEVSLDWLSERNLKRHDILNSKTINNILTEHFSGRENNDTLIWSLLVFQKWFDMYMGGRQ